MAYLLVPALTPKRMLTVLIFSEEVTLLKILKTIHYT